MLIVGEIEDARSNLDPIKDPGASFDPSNPDTAGRLVALALVSQDKIPLGRIARTYSSGSMQSITRVIIRPMRRSPALKLPIYVGKADPEQPDARTSREQGRSFSGG